MGNTPVYGMESSFFYTHQPAESYSFRRSNYNGIILSDHPGENNDPDLALCHPQTSSDIEWSGLQAMHCFPESQDEMFLNPPELMVRGPSQQELSAETYDGVSSPSPGVLGGVNDPYALAGSHSPGCCGSFSSAGDSDSHHDQPLTPPDGVPEQLSKDPSCYNSYGLGMSAGPVANLTTGSPGPEPVPYGFDCDIKPFNPKNYPAFFANASGPMSPGPPPDIGPGSTSSLHGRCLRVKAEPFAFEDLPQAASYPSPDGNNDDNYSSVEPKSTGNIKAEEADSDYEPPNKRKRILPRESRGRSRGGGTHKTTTSAIRPKNYKQPMEKRKPGPCLSPHDGRMAPPVATVAGDLGEGHISITCPQCPCQGHFRDESALQDHIRRLHKPPFHCIFAFAGCDSTFPSKNEWKRHINTQHVCDVYWVCTEGECAQISLGSKLTSPSGSSSPTKASEEPRARPRKSEALCRKKKKKTQDSSTSTARQPDTAFNRKDLFTQHLRRIHAPPSVSKAKDGGNSNKKSCTRSSSATRVPDAKAWRDREQELQTQFAITRCGLPDYMVCPGCGDEFHGINTWDNLLEHIARHLENERGRRVTYSAADGQTLIAWASRADIGVIARVGQDEGDEAGAPDGKQEWVVTYPLKMPGLVASVARARCYGLDAGYEEAGNGHSEIIVQGGCEEDAECEDEE